MDGYTFLAIYDPAAVIYSKANGAARAARIVLSFSAVFSIPSRNKNNIFSTRFTRFLYSPESLDVFAQNLSNFHFHFNEIQNSPFKNKNFYSYFNKFENFLFANTFFYFYFNKFQR